MIAAKSELQCSLVYKSITSELLSIKLHLNKSASIIIPAFYHPSNCASAKSVKCVVDELHNIRINHPNCEFWASGDFNLPDIDWSNHTMKSYQYPKSMSLEVLKLPFYCHLEQMVNMPTQPASPPKLPSLTNVYPSLAWETMMQFYSTCRQLPNAINQC